MLKIVTFQSFFRVLLCLFVGKHKKKKKQCQEQYEEMCATISDHEKIFENEREREEERGFE